MQTVLAEDNIEWSALDFSTDPPSHRSFRPSWPRITSSGAPWTSVQTRPHIGHSEWSLRISVSPENSKICLQKERNWLSRARSWRQLESRTLLIFITVRVRTRID